MSDEVPAPHYLDSALDKLDRSIATARANGVDPSVPTETIKPGVNPMDPSVFVEEPVPLSTFVQDKMYLAAPRLSDEQFRAVALGEAIYFNETFGLLSWPYMKEDWWYPSYTELAIEWGKGSGKDFIARILCARVAYLLLCLHEPQLYFNQDRASSIDILNVAVSSRQANDIFFEPLKRMVGSSPWFANKYDPKMGKILYPKNIVSISGHGDQESLEGFNLILGVADEIAAFKTKEESMARISPRAGQHSADAISEMMRSSGQSRFPGIAKVLYISYPRFRGDFIEQKYEQSTTQPSIYGTRKATWEVNPTKERKDFDEEYSKDPEGAAAKYECSPPAATNKYFRNDKAIDATFMVGNPDTPQEPVDDLGFLLPTWKPNHTKPMAGHIDLALTTDRAALCLAHMQDWNIRETADGHKLMQPIIFIDVLTSFHPSEMGLSEFDPSIMEDFIIEVMQRGGKVRKVTADQFQSRYMLQNIQKRGVEVALRSVDRDTSAYDVLKSAIYQGRLVAYHRKRIVQELKGVKILNGIKVDHEPGASKDEADALAGACAGVTELAFENLDNQVEGENADWAGSNSSWHDSAQGLDPWSRRGHFTSLGTRGGPVTPGRGHR